MVNGDKSKKPKKRRIRSPAYPIVDLGKAVDRATEFWNVEKRYSVPIKTALEHWGYSEGSGLGLRISAALKQFGLMRDEGTKENRRVQLTDLAVRILLPEPDSDDRDKALKEAALNPPLHADLWRKFGGGLPSDSAVKHYLEADRKFNDQYVSAIIKEVKATLEFAGLPESASITPEESDTLGSESTKVGDYVQWVSKGQLQFPEEEGRKVTGFSEDGEWAFVEGTESGLPVSELELTKKMPIEDVSSATVQPPANPDYRPPGIPPITSPLPRGSSAPESSSVLWLKVPFKGSELQVKVESAGQMLTSEHLARVRKYLELAEEDMESDGPELPASD